MALPVEINPLHLQSTGSYSIGKSLRFRSSASAYLNRTFTTPTNNQKWTFSGWFKLGALSGYNEIFTAGSNNSAFIFNFTGLNGALTYYEYNGSTVTSQIATTALYRDPSAWYHVVLSVDTTQATASNRYLLYVNGAQVTSFSTASYPAQNYNTYWNSAIVGYIGRESVNSRYYDGYMAEVNFIDGQALTPSSFGTYDANGVWQPVKYSGSFGTNGFYLNFGNTTSIGADTSGNGNNWTANNINVTSNNYLSFTASGANGWTAPAGVTSVTYLVVAGGGGGGSASATGTGGGGGAGGFLTGTATVTPGTTYTITVGAGGAASSNGGNSSISGAGLTTITAIGGGAGGTWNTAPGQNGGSGGGGAAGGGGGANLSAGTGTSGQGNAGGAGSTSNAPAGGGGGAGAVGGTGTSSAAGNGGVGLQSSITGSAVYYAGGGGGAAAGATAGSGGLGGGGGAGVAGTANTGGGGGGASPGATGSAGGSGIVILSYSGALQVGTTYDSVTDSPTVTSAAVGNYCVLNPLTTTSGSVTNGNLSKSTSTAVTVLGTLGVSSGKWYWEVTAGSSNGNWNNIGIVNTAYTATIALPTQLYATAYGWGYFGNTGNKFTSGVNASYGATYGSGDVIGVALDLTAGTLTFYKNGVSQGVAFTGLNTGATYVPNLDSSIAAACSADANFGQRPFTYTPPTGYNALNTYNLPTPTIANGAKYMSATTYAGSASTQVINSNMTALDFAWIKDRTSARSHVLVDTVRGGSPMLTLYSDLTSAEDNSSANYNPTSISGSSITLGGAKLGINNSGDNYVLWGWRANAGTNVSNTNGSITSTVSANTTAGFSVVTYTGTGANATVGHGLGVAPSMIIIKNRQAANSWVVYHVSAGNGNVLLLNSTNGSTADSTAWNTTTPTSSVFSLGSGAAADTNQTTGGGQHIAYCWAAVAGYSAFGSYTGNGSADGPFVYTGFRPRFIMAKDVTNTTSASWLIQDTSRDTYNVGYKSLYAEQTSVESVSSADNVDILSNGFKIRNASSAWNNSGQTFIYMAFAENPFNSSRAR
jgi:hypothetical protein